MNRSLIVGVLLLAVACHKNKDAEGPVERAGKGVDHAANKTGEALEKAAVKTGKVVKKAAKATGEALEKAGNSLQGEEDAAASPTPAPSAKPSK